MSVPRERQWALLLLGGLVAVPAWAQTASSEGDGPPRDPTQILSDVAPLPAEDRDSTGVLMDASRMGAHHDTSTAQPPGNAVKPVVGRDVSRLIDRTRSWADVRDAQSTQVPPGEASGAPPDPLEHTNEGDPR